MKQFLIKEWSTKKIHIIGCDDYSQGTCRNFAKYSIYKNIKEYHKKHTVLLIENVCEEHLQYLGENTLKNTKRSCK